MKQKPLRIAIYGKGGIGKSTIAANLSAAFAKKGLRVLQIGCDPKADSTRSLARRRIPTILQQLEHKDKLNREDILVEGRLGIGCVEAGGPEAGCGCAGLGITAAIEELESKGIMEEAWNVILYDVLGDVVCGGFSIPMRKHYVDKVYIVTSASYMSLYAANNILKGVCRYSGAKRQLAGGLIANHISSQEELEIVKTYAERVGLPLVAVLREDKQLLQADYRHELFTELFPYSDNTRALVQGAELIRYQATEENLQAGELSAQISEKASVPNLGVGIKPIPLSQEELESFGEAMARRYYE